ncbi:MAG: oligosaccharide flippase family protein [Chloroflexota bacterium]|nr:oligosaccharide flippase family protein [Chloroflexota bacterium]
MKPAVTSARATAAEEGAHLRLSVLVSNLALIAARVASMGLGFLTWLLAARLFAPADVGIASALVAAMMLCVQLGLLGIGSAVVALLPSHRAAQGHMVDVGATVVVLCVVGVTLGYFVLAGTLLKELSLVVAPGYAVLFLAMTVFGTLNTYYDYVSLALRRGDQVLVRNIAFGIVTLTVLAISASLLGGAPGSLLILLAWASAGVAACAIAGVQVARALSRRPAVRLDRLLTSRLVGVGWPNWLLTLTERAPALGMPVMIATMLGPTTNAFWYAAWMMAWVVLIIPISIGQSVYAELSRDPSTAKSSVLHGLRSSLVIGVPAALVLAVAAELALMLLGARYAAESAPALRVLVVSVVPVTVIQAYYAVSRARGALTEAIGVGALGGAATVAAALTAGQISGLVAMAAAWVVAQNILAILAGVRLWSMFRTTAAGPDPGPRR